MLREALGLYVGDVVAMPSSRLAAVFSIERQAVTFRYLDDKRAFCPLRRSLVARLVVVRRVEHEPQY